MKVLHSSSLAVSAGGPAMSTYLTLRGLRGLGVEAEVIQHPLRAGDVNRGEDVPIHYTGRVWLPKLNWVPGMKRQIEALGHYDVYHAQGVWQWQTYALVDAARQQQSPYLITPRGMLYPQDIAKASTRFKRWSLRWRLLRDLNRAACVHVTCQEERRHCRDLGVTSPIAVIPNPVDCDVALYEKDDATFRIGYMGRLSPRKHVEWLIRAVAALSAEAADVELLIIGGGEAAYERSLRDEVQRLGLKRVHFTGMLHGEVRDRALSSCSLLVLPSEFENLGNVIMEALVRGIPCVATKGSPWEELETHRCGWWVDFDQTAITDAVRRARHTAPETLRQMGLNGRKLMMQRYSVPAVARQMLQLYQWVLGEGAKPDFVYMSLQTDVISYGSAAARGGIKNR